jgi:hypothetical protein
LHQVSKANANIWNTKPAEHDYAAAEKYLSLLLKPGQAKTVVARLRRAPTIRHTAKDLLRASQTHLLKMDNPSVAQNLKKIKKGKKLSPVLVVRGDAARGVTLTIADGYHRICASWQWDEDLEIACCIADISGG